MKMFFISFLIGFALQSFAQEKECGTRFNPADTIHLTHFGNNAILDEILQVTMPNGAGKGNGNGNGNGNGVDNGRSDVGELDTGVPFRIPVKAWIYADDDNTNGAISPAPTLPMSYPDLFNYLDQVNLEFANNNTGIQFYLKCAPEWIPSTQYNTLTESEWDDLISINRDSEALNWHFVREIVDYGGLGRYPTGSPNMGLALATSGGYSINKGKSLVHEIGHTLGLLHTHENARTWNDWNGSADNCFQESVDRDRRQWGCLASTGKKCEKNGDTLCDTEAAPNREGGGPGTTIGFESMDLDGTSSTTTCTYVGGGSDNWGDPWLNGPPPTTNYMSYLEFGSCRDDFTSQQIAVMHSNIIFFMAHCDSPDCSYGPPMTGETPWYNRDAIILTGSVNNGDDESYTVPGTVQLSKNTTENHTVYSGGDIQVTSTERVVIKKGFKANAGSSFKANLTWIYSLNCNEPYPGSRVASEAYTYAIDMEMVNRVKEILAGRPRDTGSEILIESPDDLSVSVYPNPVGQELHLEFTSEQEQTATFEIIGTDGKRYGIIELDISSKGPQQKDIVLKGLPKGIYNYILYLNNKSYTGKLIKE